MHITILGNYDDSNCIYTIDNYICALHKTPMDLLEIIKLIRLYMVEQTGYENFLMLFDDHLLKNNVAEFGLKCYIIYLIDAIISPEKLNVQIKSKNNILNFLGLVPAKDTIPTRSHSQSTLKINLKDTIPIRSHSQSAIKTDMKNTIPIRSEINSDSDGESDIKTDLLKRNKARFRSQSVIAVNPPNEDSQKINRRVTHNSITPRSISQPTMISNNTIAVNPIKEDSRRIKRRVTQGSIVTRPNNQPDMISKNTTFKDSEYPVDESLKFDIGDFEIGLKKIYDTIILNVPDTAISMESYATDILNNAIDNLIQSHQICKCQYTLFIDDISIQKYGIETRMDLLRDAIDKSSFENCSNIENHIHDIMYRIRSGLRKRKQIIISKNLRLIPKHLHTEILKKYNENHLKPVYIDADNNFVNYTAPDINLNIDPEFKYPVNTNSDQDSDQDSDSDFDWPSDDSDCHVCVLYNIRNTPSNNYVYVYKNEPDPIPIYKVSFSSEKTSDNVNYT